MRDGGQQRAGQGNWASCAQWHTVVVGLGFQSSKFSLVTKCKQPPGLILASERVGPRAPCSAPLGLLPLPSPCPGFYGSLFMGTLSFLCGNGYNSFSAQETKSGFSFPQQPMCGSALLGQDTVSPGRVPGGPHEPQGYSCSGDAVHRLTWPPPWKAGN